MLELLATGEPQANAARIGARAARRRWTQRRRAGLRAIRSRGLWFGLDLDPRQPADARAVCERLLAAGVLAKDTHERTIRLAPPLTSRGRGRLAGEPGCSTRCERAARPSVRHP